MQKPPLLIAFDADGTLFNTEFLYDEARQAVVAMVAAKSGLPPEEIDAWQRARDVELAKTIGFSMHRFPGGLQDTARHFLGEGEHEMTALGFGYNVFRRKSVPVPGVFEAIHLATAAKCRIGVITAGEDTVQRDRLATFETELLLEHGGAFDFTTIVPSKIPDTFHSVKDAAARQMNAKLDADECWMIGDSLRSDIIPATKAGWNAIHVVNHNWSAMEIQGHELPPTAHNTGSLLAAVAMAIGEAGLQEIAQAYPGLKKTVTQARGALNIEAA